jgi:TetR/AcrR family transcriptional repressor of nem operon
MNRSASKRATHDRIVKVAAKRFRELGLEGISVADVMTESGGTVGGFYKHFESRDALVVEALNEAMADYDAFRGGEVPLLEFITTYLSTAHRDSPGTGCATGALLSDFARASQGARSVMTERFKTGLTVAQDAVPEKTASDRRATAILLLCAMMGAISLSRAVDDPALSKEILDATKKKLRELTCRAT